MTVLVDVACECACGCTCLVPVPLERAKGDERVVCAACDADDHDQGGDSNG